MTKTYRAEGNDRKTDKKDAKQATTIPKRKTASDEGKKDDDELVKCLRNCTYYESRVGINEARFRDIAKEKRAMSVNEKELDAKDIEFCHKIAPLERKTPNLSLDEFRELAFLKHKLTQNVLARENLSLQMAKLSLESDRVRTKIFNAANEYKGYIYTRQELLAKATNKKTKK